MIWKDILLWTESGESAILEEDASSVDDNGDFEDYSSDSYDNDISHDNNSKELYGKGQNVMSEKPTFSKCVSDNNYSHIAYVLECIEDGLGEKTMKTMTNEDILAMQTITTWAWNPKMSYSLVTVFQN